MIDGAQGVLYGYDARVEILGTRGCIFLGKTQERPITVCRSDMHRYESFTNSWKFLFKDAYLEAVSYTHLMLIAEYDYDLDVEVQREEAYAAGRQETLKELVKRKLEKGKSIDVIAEELEETTEEIARIIKSMQEA